MQCNKVYLRSLAVLAVLLLLSTGQRSTEAGNGRVETVNGSKIQELDLVAHFSIVPAGVDAPTALKEWEPVFKEYAKLLYDATEGQVRLRTVTFTTSQSLRCSADISVVPSNFKNQAGDCPEPEDPIDAASSPIGGFKQVNQAITLYPVHRNTSGGCIGQFGLLHESGHYLFGLHDEYEGCEHVAGATTCDKKYQAARKYFCSAAGCPDGEPGGSIMDGGTRMGCKTSRREFCCSNKGPFQHATPYLDSSGTMTRTTAQHMEHGMSCWDYMASAASPITLSALQSGTNPERQDLLEDFKDQPEKGLPTFEYIDAPLGVVLVLDKSASMLESATVGGTTTSMEVVRRGAFDAVDFMLDGEQFGMVTFGEEVDDQTVLFQSMETARPLAKTVISGLSAAGETTLGDAVDRAFEMVKPSAVSTAVASRRAIILLSDGLSNGGKNPLDVLEQIEKEPLVTVHTVALGAQANPSLLREIAMRTGGTFYVVDDESRMPGVLAGIVATARGDNSISIERDTVGPGKLVQFISEVPNTEADGSASNVGSAVTTFLLTHTPNANLVYSLKMPSGKRVVLRDKTPCVVQPGEDFDPDTDVCDSEGITAEKSEEQVLYRVPNAEPGAWEVSVMSPAPSGGQTGQDVQFVHTLFGGGEETCMSAVIQHDESEIKYSEPIRVLVALRKFSPIAGAVVTGEVRHPDGTLDPDPLLMYDDGTNGDDNPDDGLYTGLYSRIQPGGNGAYVFTFKAVVKDGFVAGSGEDTGTQQPRIAVAPFEATATATALLREVPESFGESRIEILGPGEPQVTVIDVEDINVTPMLIFQVKASMEHVRLASVLLTSVGSGDETTIDELALFLDTDRDGVIDNPVNPRARAVFDMDNGQALFMNEDGIALIPAGETWQFIIALGSFKAPPLSAGLPGLPPLLRLPDRPLPDGGGPWLAALAALAVLALVALRVFDLQRHPVARPLGLSLCLTLAILMVGVVGCGGGGDCVIGGTGGTGGGNPKGLGSYDMVLSPEGVLGVGATTRKPVQGQGEAVQAILRVN